MRFVIKTAALLLIDAYQSTLSPFLGGQCRFEPSCSCYARDAVRKYSFPKAITCILKRLLRCHPFSKGGWDPA